MMKGKISEKRTQVYFPVEVYRRIEKQARYEDKSSAFVPGLSWRESGQTRPG